MHSLALAEKTVLGPVRGGQRRSDFAARMTGSLSARAVLNRTDMSSPTSLFLARSSPSPASASGYVPKPISAAARTGTAWEDVDVLVRVKAQVLAEASEVAALSASESHRRGPTKRRAPTGKATVMERLTSEGRAANELAQLAEAEARAYALQAKFNALSVRAEKKQQLLEQLCETERHCKLVPVSADTSPPASAAESAFESMLSHMLGSHHPTVLFDNARLALEERLKTVGPEVLELEDYTETLGMMLRRMRETHALQLAAIGSMRDRGIVLEKEEHELKLLVGEARGAAGDARLACRETLAAREKNAAAYASRLKEREDEMALQSKRAMKQERMQHAKQRGSGDALMRSSSKAGLPTEQQQRLQRMLIATRMSSLVLLAQRDDNVEQVSRYEAAFKKMARAAGSNDAEVVIAKFVSRNETRAGLLDERGHVVRRRAELDREQQTISAKLSEMQYSMVHPAHTETALHRLDPKLTKAAGRLELLHQQVKHLRDLEMAVGSGCAALLTRVAGAVPSLGAAPDADFSIDGEKPSHSPTPPTMRRRDSASNMANGAAEAARQAVEAAEGRTGVPPALHSHTTAAQAERENAVTAAEVARDERLLSMLRVCDARLEKLAHSVDVGRALATVVEEGHERERGDTPTHGRERTGSTFSLGGSLTAGTPPLHRRSSGAGLHRPVSAASSSRGSAHSDSDHGAAGARAHGPPNAFVDLATALNIRIQPVDVEPPLGMPAPAAATARASTTGTHRVSTAPRAAMRAAASSPSAAATPGSVAAGLVPTFLTEGDDEDDTERAGFFGEERRRVKVGERPSSTRNTRPAGLQQPTPPTGGGGGSASARSRRLKPQGSGQWQAGLQRPPIS